MKVVGIGSPAKLRVRVKPCETGVLREVLYEHLDVAVEALGRRGGRIRDGASEISQERERAAAEVAAITALLDQLRPLEVVDHPYVLIGPTSVLAPVIRNAASEAVERLSTAV